MEGNAYYALVQGRFYTGDIEGRRYHWKEGIPGSRQLAIDLAKGKKVNFIYYRPWDQLTKRGKCFYGYGVLHNQGLVKFTNQNIAKIEYYCDILNYSDFPVPVNVNNNFKKMIWPGANRHAGIRRILESVFNEILTLGNSPVNLNGLANFVGEANLEDILNNRIAPDDLKDFEGVVATRRAVKTEVYKRSQRVIKKLKKRYKGICQVTGQILLSAKDYGVDVTEAHHIQYLSDGGTDGNSANVIIVSPEWHRLLHKKNPRFDKERLSFIFEDGKMLQVRFPGHLKSSKNV